MAATDKRVQKRRHLFYYLNVVKQQTGEPVGRVVDITTAGVLVISEKTFQDGEVMHVEIQLDDQLLEAMHGNLKLDIECRWTKKDVNPQYNVTGFSFVDVNEEQQILINKLISMVGFSDM